MAGALCKATVTFVTQQALIVTRKALAPALFTAEYRKLPSDLAPATAFLVTGKRKTF